METETVTRYAKARTLFQELGELTADQIHDRVKAAGIVGEQGNSVRCPLALLVARELGFELSIASTTWFVQGTGESGSMPESCRRFVDIVDQGDIGAGARYGDVATPYDGDGEDY